MKDYIKPRLKKRAEDLVGTTHGLLVVTGVLSINGAYRYQCKCECGRTIIARRSRLLSGRTWCCGCKRKESIGNAHATHRMSDTPTYKSWANMKDRCNNPKSIGWKNYGGRGIRVCERWLISFENFLNDMGERPKGKTLDRINVNGDYCKENCRWATHKQQNNNKRNNVIISFAEDSDTLTMVSEKNGAKTRLVRERLSRGWSVEEALFLPRNTLVIHNEMRIMYDNTMMSISEVAKKCGMKPSLLYGRIFVCGWSLNDAVSLKKNKKPPIKPCLHVITNTINGDGLVEFSTGIVMQMKDAVLYVDAIKKHGICQINDIA